MARQDPSAAGRRRPAIPSEAFRLRRFAVFVLLVLVAASPLAQAVWSAKGAREPDTARDVQDGFVLLDPDASPDSGIRTVYFNGFMGTNAGAATSFNPNLGRAGTAILPYPTHPVALLGVWKDCNDDGYVGLGDNGLFEYRAELLTNRSICPPDLRSPASVGFLIHNDGQWVQEFHPIGYDDVNSNANGIGVDQNPYNYNDTAARVWADFDLPESSLRPTCAVRPPVGSLRTTGGVLRWADCATGYKGVAAFDGAARAAGMGDLAFDDAPRDRPDRSRSPLNRPNPWGDEDDAAMARVFDCSDPGTPYRVDDPTSGGLRTVIAIPQGDGSTFYVNGTDDQGRILYGTARLPGAYAPDPEGTPAGTVNETEEALDKCDRRDDARTNAHAPYALEGEVEPTSAFTGRTRPDFTFTFEEGDRQPGGARFALGAGWRGPDADGGTGAATLQGFWVATAASTVSRNPYVHRDELAPEPATYVTYYAHVSLTTIVQHGLRTPGQVGAYGAEACGMTPSPFVCNPAKWWRDATGASVVPRDARLGSADGGITARPVPHTEIGVRVLQPYRFRDIDCYDQSADAARAQGVDWGLVTGFPCDRPETP